MEFTAPILPRDEIAWLGGEALALHNYYMTASRENKKSITLFVKPKHFLKGDEDYVVVNFCDSYDLYHHTALDVSIVSSHSGGKISQLAFSTQMQCHLPINSSEEGRNEVKKYLVRALSHFQNARKQYIIFAYNSISAAKSSHWILVVIVPSHNKVLYLDSPRHIKLDYTDLIDLLDAAYDTYLDHYKMKKSKLTHITDFEVPPAITRRRLWILCVLSYVVDHESSSGKQVAPGDKNPKHTGQEQ
ncbi:hypothetical protein ACP4OV_013422 [Aristida adscensionis]